MTKICLIAETADEARRWANSQNLSSEQYFYARNVIDVITKNNFHVIALGIPSSHFERLYELALVRGKIGRI